MTTSIDMLTVFCPCALFCNVHVTLNHTNIMWVGIPVSEMTSAYRIFARIRHFFRAKVGQNWGVRLICELELKLYLPEFFLILKYNVNYCIILS